MLPTNLRNRVQRFAVLTVVLFTGALVAACGQQATVEPTPVPADVVEATTAPAVQPTEPMAAQPTTAAEGGEMAGEPMEVTLSEISDNPDAYLGQTVSVIGDVTTVIGPRSFTLNDPALIGLDSLLVVGADETVIPQDNDIFIPDTGVGGEVVVTGTVREYDQQTFASEYGYEFTEEGLVEYGGRATIVADDIEVLSQDEAVGPIVGTEPVAGTFLTPGDITADPTQYAGQTVTVNGEVDESLGANAFRMDDGGIFDLGGEMLVVIPADVTQPDTLVNETNVQVRGTVQNYVQADFERDYGFIFDDPSLDAEFENQPALVAEAIFVRATVSDIDDDAEAYIGNRVTVLGDVIELIDDRTFRLDDPALLGGDDILVTTREGIPVTEGEQVYVTGEVREFDAAAISTELGFDYGTDVYAPYTENTIIIAERIETVGQAGGFFGDIFGADETTGISEITGDPAAYVGQLATINGEIDEVIGPNTYRVDEDNLLELGDDMLVFIPDEINQPDTLVDETNVRVSGTVQNFVIADFERDYGFVFDDPGIYAEFENQPAIIAERIQVQATLSDVDDNPEAYIGNMVSVYGEASELIGDNSFRLQDPAFFAGDDVLVVVRDQAIIPTEGAEYWVTGEVRAFNLTEVEADVGYDLDDALFTDWEGRTVIVAEMVQAGNTQ